MCIDFEREKLVSFDIEDAKMHFFLLILKVVQKSNSTDSPLKSQK